MFCGKCGHKNPDNSAFCGKCGQRIILPSQPVAQRTTTVQHSPVVAQPKPPVQQSLSTKQKPPLQQNTKVQNSLAKSPPAPKKEKSGNGGLIITAIILTLVIIGLIGLLIYTLLDDSAEDSTGGSTPAITTAPFGGSNATTIDTNPHESNDSESVPPEATEYPSETQPTTQVTEVATESIEPTTETPEPSTEPPTEATTEPTAPATEAGTQWPYNTAFPYVTLDENGYYIADSDKRFLTWADVSSLSKDQIQYAINEIYARRGRIFNATELQTHFESLPWYHGTIPAESFSNEVFNAYEKANVDFLYICKNSM